MVPASGLRVVEDGPWTGHDWSDDRVEVVNGIPYFWTQPDWPDEA